MLGVGKAILVACLPIGHGLIPLFVQASEPVENDEITEVIVLDQAPHWVDSSHSFATNRAQTLAQWMDDFFGAEVRDAERADTFVRAIGIDDWDNRDQHDFRFRVRGQVSLPKISERVDLIFSGEEAEQTLTEEERSLTQRRPSMTPEAFRAEADAFDEKVQEVRRARDAKNSELQAASARARAEFEERVQSVIVDVMLDRGALMVMDQRNVILSVRAANITDDVIVRIDAALGDGTR